MPNPWFRLYSEFADDPKVQMMSESDQRRLVMLFCEHCKDVTHDETLRSFHWRVSPLELLATKAIFLQNGFIDEDWNLLNWNRRQYLSDSSTERVRRHREKKKEGSPSSQGNGFIYFALWNDRVKIGYSDNPWSRMDGLRPNFPGIKLLATREGTQKEEKALHMKWGSQWIEGEWFSFSGPLKFSIESMKETEGNVTSKNVTPLDTDTDTEQKQIQKKKVPATSAFELPPWIDKDAWNGFEEMRRKIRKPMTDRAREMAVKALVDLEAKGYHAEDVLNQSTLNSWQGLFEVRNNGGNNGTSRTQQREQRNAEAVREGVGPSQYARGRASGVAQPPGFNSRPRPDQSDNDGLFGSAGRLHAGRDD